MRYQHSEKSPQIKRFARVNLLWTSTFYCGWSAVFWPATAVSAIFWKVLTNKIIGFAAGELLARTYNHTCTHKNEIVDSSKRFPTIMLFIPAVSPVWKLLTIYRWPAITDGLFRPLEGDTDGKWHHCTFALFGFLQSGNLNFSPISQRWKIINFLFSSFESAAFWPPSHFSEVVFEPGTCLMSPKIVALQVSSLRSFLAASASGWRSLFCREIAKLFRSPFYL